MLLCGDCATVERVVSALTDDKADEDNDDVNTASLNPVVVSMLALPLLQIVSLPQTATEHREAVDCQMTARHLLSVVRHYATQRHHPHRHGDASTGALHVMPSAVSHTCRAYVELARHLSEHVTSDHVGDSDVVKDWLQQVHSLMSADLQPSSLFTLLVASLFLLHDDAATVDRCLQLLHVICQSDKTQVSVLPVHYIL